MVRGGTYAKNLHILHRKKFDTQFADKTVFRDTAWLHAQVHAKDNSYCYHVALSKHITQAINVQIIQTGRDCM